jgi:hypothetical protein
VKAHPVRRGAVSLGLFGLMGVAVLIGIGAGAAAFPVQKVVTAPSVHTARQTAMITGGTPAFCNGAATLTASPSMLAVHQYTLLHARITWAPLTPPTCAPHAIYVYLGLPYGCSSLNAPSVLCSPGQRGVYTVTVLVSEPGSPMMKAQTALKVI